MCLSKKFANMLPKEETRHFYEIALSFVPDVGPKTTRALLSKFETPDAVFKAPLKELTTVNGVTEVRARMFHDEQVMKQAEREMEFVLKNNIGVLFMGTERYPKRLSGCEDAPVLLYSKGNADPNVEKVVAVIGTRTHTDYGQRATEDFLNGLHGMENILIVSGLALGIDTIAHKSSLKNGLPTIGVMGNGIDMVYPYSNKTLATEMLHQGGLLTEFPFGTKPQRQHFPVRNRVVAGMSDVTVIVESEIKGGAMITAYVAHSYNREVAAFPGRAYDTKSNGPNLLIKRNIAAMITNAEDLTVLMNWGKHTNVRSKPPKLFVQLSDDEQIVYDLLQAKEMLHADELLHHSGLSNPRLAAALLQLEMQELIKALPGKQYRLN